MILLYFNTMIKASAPAFSLYDNNEMVRTL